MDTFLAAGEYEVSLRSNDILPHIRIIIAVSSSVDFREIGERGSKELTKALSFTVEGHHLGGVRRVRTVLHVPL